MNSTWYRYPSEQSILWATLSIVLVVIIITATATFCGSAVFILLAVGYAFLITRSHHQSLIQNALPVTPQTLPELYRLVDECAHRLGVSGFHVYVTRSSQLNAYTFGLSNPKVVVLYSPLLEIMDRDELAFIIGHELGHIRLGHTWLNSLVGGMAGIPSSGFVSVMLMFAFLSWNRACEYSADRAGILANGNPNKAITALIKLVAGPAGLTERGLAAAYQQIDAEDDTWLGNLSEAFASHPLLIRRIDQLKKFAHTSAYMNFTRQGTLTH
ncbi:MAG: M48 family metallopeptidase [Chloroflexota bacterium]